MTKVARLSDQERARATYRVQYSDKNEWMMAVASDGRLSATDVRVAVLLCGHVNARSGRAWPTVTRLAEAAHASLSSTKRALRKLVTAGFLNVHRRGGRGNANFYEMNLKAAGDNALKGVTGDPVSSEKRVTSEPKRGQNQPIKGVTSDPQIERKEIKKTRARTREGNPPPPHVVQPSEASTPSTAPHRPQPPEGETRSSGSKRAEFIATDDPRWEDASAIHHQLTGKPPMTVHLHGREGWLFAVAVLDRLPPGVSGPS